MRISPHYFAIACVLGLVPAIEACGSSSHQAWTSRSGSSALFGARESKTRHHPRIVELVQTGVRYDALAYAVPTQASPIANHALATILKNRLVALGFPSEAHSNAFGVTLSFQIATRSSLATLLKSLQSALSNEVAATEFDAKLLEDLARTWSPSRVMPEPEIDLAHCSGEPYVSAEQAGAIANHPQLVQWVEAARANAYSASAGVLSWVGSADSGSDVEQAVADMSPWPETTAPTSDPRQLAASPISVTVGPTWRLSIAYRLSSFDTAAGAWKRLRLPRSVLALALKNAGGGWGIEAVSAVARPNGACLRLDLSKQGEGGADLDNLRPVIRALGLETQFAIGAARSTPPDWRDMLGLHDSALIAEQLAWSALSSKGNEEPVPHVHLRGPDVEHLRAAIRTTVLEELQAREPVFGQIVETASGSSSEYWLLVASSCGLRGEHSGDIGSTAAWLRALARKYSGYQGVTIEPWISPQGVGLFGHCNVPRADGGSDAAAKVSNALGAVIASGSLSGSDLAAIRESMFVDSGLLSRPELSYLLGELSPESIAMYAPFGTLGSLRHLDLQQVEARGRRWLREPLRAAVASPAASSTTTVVSRQLGRWLGAPQHRQSECQSPAPELNPRLPEDFNLPMRTATGDAHAYVVFYLRPASSHRGLTELTELGLEWLLENPSGWSSRLLAEPALALKVGTFFVGPTSSRKLIVEVHGRDEASLSAVVKQLQSLSSGLAAAGVSAKDLEFAYAWAKVRSSSRRNEMRYRLVEAWLNEDRNAANETPNDFASALSASIESVPSSVVRVPK